MASVGLVAGVAIWAALARAGIVPVNVAPRVDDEQIALARGPGEGPRVLFVGNSLTWWNQMPATLRKLSESDAAASAVFPVEFVGGGYTLERHARHDRLRTLLQEVRWTHVVLQEQSQLPSFDAEQREAEMYPFVRALDAQVERAGAQTVLFETWGHRDGDQRNRPGRDTYEAMQARVHEGYWTIAAERSLDVAPVGLAWEESHRRRPGLDLWSDDGRHPGPMGSYLAACVFYGMLVGDPTAATYAGELDGEDAAFLRTVAAEVVDALDVEEPSWGT